MIKKDNENREKTTKPSFSEVMENTLGNKSFCSVVIMTVFWYATRYMTVGFLGTFKSKDLVISIGQYR